MSDKGDRQKKEGKAQVITLDDNAILAAIIQYVQAKHPDGQVADVEWLLEPEAGYELPPIKGIAVRCTLD